MTVTVGTGAPEAARVGDINPLPFCSKLVYNAFSLSGRDVLLPPTSLVGDYF